MTTHQTDAEKMANRNALARGRANSEHGRAGLSKPKSEVTYTRNGKTLVIFGGYAVIRSDDPAYEVGDSVRINRLTVADWKRSKGA